jgi:uncharacterized protein YbjT (DUF2867 family)
MGATGFLGEPVAIHLKKRDFAVRIMARDIEKAAKRFGEKVIFKKLY